MDENLQVKPRLSRFSLSRRIGIAALAPVLILGILIFSNNARMAAVRMGLSFAGATAQYDQHGFTNILLLGVGDETHDAADLTDAMIVASIDPSAHGGLVLLSLPRDLLVDPQSVMVRGRINAIYANEKYRLKARKKLTEEEASIQALRAVADEIGKNMQIPIHGVIKVDFTAFTEVVDALGGVEVDVKERIIDYSYPYAEGRVGTFELLPGVQHMDGEMALRFARSRHNATDFDRSERQQQLLAAMNQKLRSLGPLDQLSFLKRLHAKLREHVVTTMSLQDLLGVAQVATKVSFDRIVTMQINFNAGSDWLDAQAGGFVYPAPPELFEGASVLIPAPLPGKPYNWSQIATFVHFLLERRDLYIDQATVQLSNVNAPVVQAHRLRNELLRYGFVTDETFVPQRDEQSTSFSGSFISYNSNGKDTAVFLGHLLGMPVAGSTKGQQSASGDVVIYLGREFMFEPFQTLSGGVLSF